MDNESELAKFKIKKQSLIKHCKNERGAGRKVKSESNEPNNKHFGFYLTETEAKKFREYREKNKLTCSSFIGSLLREKGVFK